MRTRSVHSFGLGQPLVVITLAEGRVRHAMVLRPRRVAFDSGATWVAEQWSPPLPPLGLQVAAVPILGACREH